VKPRAVITLLVAAVIAWQALGILQSEPAKGSDLQMRSRLLGVPENEVGALEAQLDALEKTHEAKGVSQEVRTKERITLMMEARAKHSPWAKVDLIFYQRREKLGYEGLMQEEKEHFAAALLDADVKNGGFDQYFHNYSGNYAPEARSALVRHGAQKTVAILDKAMALVGTPYPKDQETRNRIMDEKTGRRRYPPFEELDEAFYKLKEDIEEPALLAMVEAYRKAGIELPELPRKRGQR
jgi:hypothetical protein